MNYGTIKKTDIANGEGVRVSLFVSGCRNRCKGCFNHDTWDFKYGHAYTDDTEHEIIEALRPSYISGLSLLGGDPMESENRTVLINLLKKVKEIYPQKNIWMYTGYLYEDLKDLEIMNYIDVLVDGRFMEDLKDISLQFKGSSNQRIIDVKKSKDTNDIKLWR